MGMIGGDGPEKVGVAWAESSATEDSRLLPVRPHLEALLRTDWRRSQSAAEAKPNQAGRA